MSTAKSSAINFGKEDRILVRGVNWLGDAIMSTPALMRLRDAKPKAHIALLTQAKLADLWSAHPAIDEVVTFTKADGIGNVSKRLRAGKYDLAIILPNSFRSACESWMAGIPTRVGFGGHARGMLLTHIVLNRPTNIEMHKRTTSEVLQLVKDSPEKPRDRFPHSGHHLHNYLHLIAALGANPSPMPPRIAVTSDEISTLREKLNLSPNFPVVVINPGAEYGPAKRWPTDRFIQTALCIEAEHPCTWLITGGPGDTALGTEILAALQKQFPSAPRHKFQNLAGKTSLRELCVVLATADVVLTNDTGPMHLAAAVGNPVVVPFGSTSPELTGPGFPGDERHRLILGQAPCAPCFRRECPIDFRCMLSISPTDAAGEILKILREANPDLNPDSQIRVKPAL
ncbi:MAG TPA: lipopolysaccharide heptosyltransferase II [Verrucomicrobiae bacterium]